VDGKTTAANNEGAFGGISDISQLGPVEFGAPPRTKFGRWAKVNQVDLAKLPPGIAMVSFDVGGIQSPDRVQVVIGAAGEWLELPVPN